MRISSSLAGVFTSQSTDKRSRHTWQSLARYKEAVSLPLTNWYSTLWMALICMSLFLKMYLRPQWMRIRTFLVLWYSIRNLCQVSCPMAAPLWRSCCITCQPWILKTGRPFWTWPWTIFGSSCTASLSKSTFIISKPQTISSLELTLKWRGCWKRRNSSGKQW